MKRDANTIGNSASTSACPHLVCLTSARWCIALPTSPCRPTKGWYAAQALDTLRQRRIILPALSVIECVCAEAVTRANRRIYRILLEPLQPHHLRGLDNLLNVAPDINLTWLVWLRQPPLRPNSRYVQEHIERLEIFRSLALPDWIGRQIHQNRLLKMAREGAQMTPRDLGDFEDERRYAPLVALVIEGEFYC